MTSSSRGGELTSAGVRNHASSSVAPSAVMPERLLRTSLAVAVGLDQPIAFEALQGRVHLANVQRPYITRALLELLAQLQPVLRSLTQQR